MKMERLIVTKNNDLKTRFKNQQNQDGREEKRGQNKQVERNKLITAYVIKADMERLKKRAKLVGDVIAKCLRRHAGFASSFFHLDFS